jgi:F420 biosynthesis protein FbiB-like protein
VLSGLASRQRLAEAMGAEFLNDLLADGLTPEDAVAQVERSRRRINEAPAAILLCLETSELDSYPDERRQNAEHLMAVQSVAMAGQNLLLAAHAEGLGGVWMCAPLFAPQAVKRSLALPETWEPQGLVLLGYAEGIPPPRSRKSIHDVAVFFGS